MLKPSLMLVQRNLPPAYWQKLSSVHPWGNTPQAYADSLTIHHYGNTLVIEIVNPVEYASYVEYGHRTANHKGWVQGRFMLTISEQEIQNIAPKVLESKIKKFLGECLQ